MASSFSTALESIRDASTSDLSNCDIDLLKAALVTVKKAIDAKSERDADADADADANTVISYAETIVFAGWLKSDDFKCLETDIKNTLLSYFKWMSKISNTHEAFFRCKSWTCEEHKEKSRRIIELNDLQLDLTGLVVAEESFRQTKKPRTPAMFRRINARLSRLVYYQKKADEHVGTARKRWRTADEVLPVTESTDCYSIPSAVPTHDQPYFDADTRWLNVFNPIGWSLEGENHDAHPPSFHHNQQLIR